MAGLTRDDYICHILQMKQWDADYARSALRWYHQTLPWIELMAGVREALNDPAIAIPRRGTIPEPEERKTLERVTAGKGGSA